MKAHRKIIAYIATSADGYIARPNGDVEWLNRRPRKFDYGINAFYAHALKHAPGRRTFLASASAEKAIQRAPIHRGNWRS